MGGVDFDDVMIGIENIDLRKTCFCMRLELHLGAATGFAGFGVAQISQAGDGGGVIGDAYCKVHVPGINFIIGPKGGAVVDDQMKLLAGGNLEPSSGKGKARARNFGKTQDIAVESARAVEIGGRKGDVVKQFNCERWGRHGGSIALSNRLVVPRASLDWPDLRVNAYRRAVGNQPPDLLNFAIGNGDAAGGPIELRMFGSDILFAVR